jgi:hypothetical protein
VNLRELFVTAVANSEGAPNDLRTNASSVTALEEHKFDATYIDFLDEQIGLNARGAEWTQRLQRRRDALRPFCNITLVRGIVHGSGAQYTVEIQPTDQRIVHWEEYEVAAD